VRGSAPPAQTRRTVFQHEAFVYRGEAEFVAETAAFIREGLAAGEPVMVAVVEPKIDLLRAELDGEAGQVAFVDMGDLGRNPARILPAWRQFADEHAGRAPALRGVGEPIWGGRQPAEIAESQLHEALLNLAFGDGPRFRLRCPYDARALAGSVVEAAHRSHPVVVDVGGRRARYAGAEHATAVFAAGLPEPAGRPDMMLFGPDDLRMVREVVLRHAGRLGLDPERCAEMVLAVHEVASNSLRYGGERGTLRVWSDPAALVCEIRDRGHITQPLVGRELPNVSDEGGRGLWLANQLCDLVQIRSSTGGTVVRLHVRL
jgi:anti-sigma regulatory factor (Ser/Thr protein kinase)